MDDPFWKEDKPQYKHDCDNCKFLGRYMADADQKISGCQEIDMYYQNMVKAQVNLVKNNTNISTSNKEDFLDFMIELDEEYKILKLDLSDNLDNQRVLEAIISNYKKRIELIENLLEQINDSKNNTDDNAYIL